MAEKITELLQKLKTDKKETVATAKRTDAVLPEDKSKEKKLLIATGQQAYDYANYLHNNWGTNSGEYKTNSLVIKPFDFQKNLTDIKKPYTKYAITNPNTLIKIIDYIADIMYKNHTYFNGKINYDIKTVIDKKTIEDMQKNNSILPDNKDYSSTRQRIISTLRAINDLQVALPEETDNNIETYPHLFKTGRNKTTGDFIIYPSKDSENFWQNYFKPFLPTPEETRSLVGNDYIFAKLVYRLINLNDRQITNQEIIDTINIDLNKVGKNPKERLKMPIDKLIDTFNENHKDKTIQITKNIIWQNIKIVKGYRLTDTKDKFIKAKNKIEFIKVEQAENKKI